MKPFRWPGTINKEDSFALFTMEVNNRHQYMRRFFPRCGIRVKASGAYHGPIRAFLLFFGMIHTSEVEWWWEYLYTCKKTPLQTIQQPLFCRKHQRNAGTYRAGEVILMMVQYQIPAVPGRLQKILKVWINEKINKAGDHCHMTVDDHYHEDVKLIWRKGGEERSPVGLKSSGILCEHKRNKDI